MASTGGGEGCPARRYGGRLSGQAGGEEILRGGVALVYGLGCLQPEAAEEAGVEAFPRTCQKNGYDSVVGIDLVDQLVGCAGIGEAVLPEALQRSGKRVSGRMGILGDTGEVGLQQFPAEGTAELGDLAVGLGVKPDFEGHGTRSRNARESLSPIVFPPLAFRLRRRIVCTHFGFRSSSRDSRSSGESLRRAAATWSRVS
jgi:hypothetical protein